MSLTFIKPLTSIIACGQQKMDKKNASNMSISTSVKRQLLVEETVKILAAERNDAPPRTLYASGADFCRIFEKDMNHLYSLSLLLTGDQELAEKCFVGGLEDAKGGNRVFKEWAQSWARRTIILNAIRMIAPRPEENLSGSGADWGDHGLPAEFAAVIGLGVFDRFVFVMSVLEGYPLRECKLLLNCSSSDVTQAQKRAFEHLGRLAERRSKAENVIRLQSKTYESELTPVPGTVTPLAVPA